MIPFAAAWLACVVLVGYRLAAAPGAAGVRKPRPRRQPAVTDLIPTLAAGLVLLFLAGCTWFGLQEREYQQK